MHIALIVFGIIAVVGGVIAISMRLQKKRTEAMRSVAATMNFTFAEKPDTALRERLSHLHLFSQGHSKKIRNVLTGRAGEMDARVFDYRFTTGGGKNSHTWRQTVMLCESAKMSLPKFALRPEHFFHKIGQVFGFQDIDFDSHPDFSKRYLLKGDDEREIRKLFDTNTLSFYESHSKLSTEAASHQLIHYHASKRAPPEKMSEFIREGVEVLTLLRT